MVSGDCLQHVNVSYIMDGQLAAVQLCIVGQISARGNLFSHVVYFSGDGAVCISLKINDTFKWAKSANNGAREIKFALSDVRENGQHKGLSFRQISKLFAAQVAVFCLEKDGLAE